MQTYALIAIGVGLVIGGVTGGRISEIANKRFRWWGLLLVGMALQLVLEYEDAPAPFLLLLVSYACLLGFTTANLRVRGMGVVSIGVALNALVIAANSGMPVREEAVRAAGMVDRDKPVRVRDAKHVLETPDTKFAVIGDIIPVAPLRQVVSFGDLILTVGIADMVVRMMKPDRRSRRQFDVRDEANQDEVVVDLTRLERAEYPAGARS